MSNPVSEEDNAKEQANTNLITNTNYIAHPSLGKSNDKTKIVDKTQKAYSH
jgi:hypothetical protein